VHNSTRQAALTRIVAGAAIKALREKSERDAEAERAPI